MRIIGWIATILFILFCFHICSETASLPDQDKMYIVTYEVECDASCDIHYVNSTGGMSVADNMKKWAEVLYLNGGTFVRVSAQNNRTSGKVVAKIKINGVVVYTEECKGRYCIAAPSGSVREPAQSE